MENLKIENHKDVIILIGIPHVSRTGEVVMIVRETYNGVQGYETYRPGSIERFKDFIDPNTPGMDWFKEASE